MRREEGDGVIAHHTEVGDEHPGMEAAFAKDLEVMGGNAVSMGEKRYESRGRTRWMTRTMCMAGVACMATRFILASDHWPDKLNHDVTQLPERVVGRLGDVLLLPLSDGRRRYREGYVNTMRDEPRPVTVHIPDASINNGHANNNRHERHYGDAERRKKGSR